MARDTRKASIWDTAGTVAMAMAMFFLVAQVFAQESVYIYFLCLGALSFALALIFWLIDRWVGGEQYHG